MKIKDYIPGFAVVLVIAVLSYYISTLHASFDALVVSIIIGIFLGNMISIRDYFGKGVDAAIKVFLPAGIALYGTQLVFNELNPVLLLTIFLVFSSLFGLTLLVSNLFSINKKIAILLASGLAICGASAIAIISPLIGARREDTSISLISVMMLGLTGMIFYPILSDMFSLTSSEFNFLAGTTLPMLGQVKVAAFNNCPECVKGAIEIKLIRISFLFFLVTIAVFLSGKEEKKVRVPWFIILFIVLAFLVNLIEALAPAVRYFKIASGFLLSAGLAAIGFSVDFDSIIDEGIAPLVTIFISWGVTVMMIYLVRNVF